MARVRYASKVAYDGTAYCGFQRQRSGPSIQQTLENALTKIAARPVKVTGAGRTDAGVHASGQVIAFDLDWRHGPRDLRNALNAELPPGIASVAVWQTADDFHPRYDALSRTYLYRLYVAEVQDPLRQRFAWHVTAGLDIRLMKQAAQQVVGTHDFTSFGLPPRGDNPTREVFRAEWEAHMGYEYVFSITANAFLFRMVRTLVATMVRVGQKRMTVEDFRAILAARQRGLAAPLAPARGLILADVAYDSPELVNDSAQGSGVV